MKTYINKFAAFLAVALISSVAFASTQKVSNSILAVDDLGGALDKKSPEEIEKMEREAAAKSLKSEREVAAEEIDSEDSYTDEGVESAGEILDSKTQNTQSDNISRIIKAFAAVEPKIKSAHDALIKKDYKAAAKILKKQKNVKEKTYKSAVIHWLYAKALDSQLDEKKALNKQGKIVWDCLEAYRDLVYELGDKISFASEASIRCAEILEKMNRRFYALEMYQLSHKNYGLTMSRAQKKHVIERGMHLQELYGDPMKSVTGMMSDVKDRLEKIKVDKKTVKKEDEIIILLEDLIKTAEEKERNKKNQKPKPNASKQKKSKKKKNGQQQGGKPKPGQPKPGKGGKKSGKMKKPGNKKTKTPMKKSMLGGGTWKRPDKISEVRSKSDESGKWSMLPPRARKQLKDAIKRKTSQRRRAQARAVTKALANTNE